MRDGAMYELNSFLTFDLSGVWNKSSKTGSRHSNSQVRYHAEIENSSVSGWVDSTSIQCMMRKESELDCICNKAMFDNEA